MADYVLVAVAVLVPRVLLDVAGIVGDRYFDLTSVRERLLAGAFVLAFLLAGATTYYNATTGGTLATSALVGAGPALFWTSYAVNPVVRGVAAYSWQLVFDARAPFHAGDMGEAHPLFVLLVAGVFFVVGELVVLPTHILAATP
ncbi:hypothetical protein [Halorubellus litoreus]|uniref:Uncharacterized protein n=1 Tax=Halorubellus litoreus TaxID=755308 RepID=A0ABD5VNA7_9EURY